MNQTQRVGELVENHRSVETRPKRRKEFRYPTHELVQINLLVSLGCIAGVITHAAPLTYSTMETISLSTPATDFTIAAGSFADSLQVNATSVIVTLSSST